MLRVVLRIKAGWPAGVAGYGQWELAPRWQLPASKKSGAAQYHFDTAGDMCLLLT
jgi:hypothetical protein